MYSAIFLNHLKRLVKMLILRHYFNILLTIDNLFLRKTYERIRNRIVTNMNKKMIRQF